MANTTLDRNTILRGPIRQEVFPIKPNAAVIPRGTLVGLSATGAVPADDSAVFKVAGIAAHRADYAAGDRFITVEKGIFTLDNDGNLASPADLQTVATVLDNHTVSKASVTTSDNGAGIVVGIDAEGVQVDMTGAIPAAT